MDVEAMRLHREGVKTMLDEAMGGHLPSPPGVTVPSDFTAEKVLLIHADMQKHKLEKVGKLAAATDGKHYSPEELGKAAAMISMAAEQETFEMGGDHLGKDGEIFHAALAQHSRDADFRARMAVLDAEHRRALVAALRAENPPAPPAGAG